MRVLLVFVLLQVVAYATVRDGSFEDNVNNTSVFWQTENNGSDLRLICSLADCEGADEYSPGPRTGKFFVWIMGLGYAASDGFVSQRVKKDTDLAVLRFYLQINTTGDNGGHLDIYTDQTLLASFTNRDCDDFARYTLVEEKLDIEGDSFDLRFEYHSFQNSDYNLTHFFIDDVSVDSVY